MSTVKRIETLERVVAQLAEHAVAQAHVTTAQAVVCRAVADLLARGTGSLDDVRDHALEIAAGMPVGIDIAVRTLLAEAPAGAGTAQ